MTERAPAVEQAPGEPVTLEGLVGLLERQRAGADAACRGHGLGPVNRLLSEVATAVLHGRCADGEFAATLTLEVARRYLRAVRGHDRAGHGTGGPVACGWRVVLECWYGQVTDRQRCALAGVHALVEHDLVLAVVSACTLLGRAPGRVEHRDVDVLLGVIADGTRDVPGVEALLDRPASWRNAEHLWMLRGRPAEAAAEQAALDRRAGLVALGLLGGPVR